MSEREREQGDLPVLPLTRPEQDEEQEFTLPSAVSVPVHLSRSEHLTAMWRILELTSVFPLYVIKNL